MKKLMQQKLLFGMYKDLNNTNGMQKCVDKLVKMDEEGRDEEDKLIA